MISNNWVVNPSTGASLGPCTTYSDTGKFFVQGHPGKYRVCKGYELEARGAVAPRVVAGLLRFALRDAN